MHDTAYEIGRIFFQNFVGLRYSILELGSLDINGSLRDLAPPDSNYIGADMVSGKSVDLVLDDPHQLPIQDETVDLVVSSSCLEHDNFFWLSFLEMCRVTREGGFIYINAPSNGAYHTHPVDCWRFYPDAANALVQWAEYNGILVTLIESFTSERKGEPWNDCVMVFQKGSVKEYAGPFISDIYLKFYNLTKFPNRTASSARAYTEDMAIVDKYRSLFLLSKSDNIELNKRLDHVSNVQSDFNASLRKLSSSLAGHHTVLTDMAIVNPTNHEATIKQQNESKERDLKIDQLKLFLNAQVQWPSSFQEFLYRLLPSSWSEALRRTTLSRDILFLNRSALFDPHWYRDRYPDVSISGIDPATHYVLHGEIEGRKPGPGFDHALQTVVTYRGLVSTGCYHVNYLRAFEGGKYSQPVSLEQSVGNTTTIQNVDVDIKKLFRELSPRENEAGTISVLFIGHEASLTGAPIGLLELITELSEHYPITPWLVLQNGGPLLDKYKEIASVLLIPDLTQRTGSFEKSVDKICNYFEQMPGLKVAVANTAAVDSLFCHLFKQIEIPYFVWIQESADAIEHHFGGREKMRLLSEKSSSLVFLSQLCYKDNISRFELRKDNATVIESGVRLVESDLSAEEIKNRICREMKIPENARLVLGCGTIEHRKGTDLFIQVAARFYSRFPNQCDDVYFIWVGKSHYPLFTNELLADINESGLVGRIHFTGERMDAHLFFKASDVFLFTSRNETLGLVALEAIGYKIPVVGFENATGAAPFIARGFGHLVPYLGVSEMTDALKDYLLRDATIREDGDNFIQEHFSPSMTAHRFYNEINRAVILDNRGRSKRILVVSAGCPPLCGNRAEGGGLRAWALAKYVKRLLPEFHVALTYSERLESNIEDDYYEGVLVQRKEPHDLKSLVSSASTVIVSYCSGTLSETVTELLEPSQQLILDCYVPIYVELCARKSDNVQREFEAYEKEIITFNKNLKRGDLFLCASRAQITFYHGVLSALGRINPKSYHDIGLRIVPYGIDSTSPIPKIHPIKERLGKDFEVTRKILWFGAVYPWFNIGNLLEAIRILNKNHPTRLFVVGARNPFNQHPDFVEAAEKATALFSSLTYRDIVYTHPWVRYEDRADWYLDCDLIITLNEPGIENGLSWRTRVADYVWSGMPLATNGGDPLGEDLISCGAACRLDVTSPSSIAETVAKLFNDETTLKKMKQRMSLYRPNLYWEDIVKPLVDGIQTHALGTDRL